MAAIWSDDNRLSLWLEIELQVCEARAGRGQLDPAAARTIRTRARADAAAVASREAVTEHDVAAFVDVVADAVGPAGRHVHWGLTSSDVLDTALALQLRDAGKLLLAGVD